MVNQNINRQAAPRGWRERMMRNLGMDVSAPLWTEDRRIPHWLTGKALIFFFVAMFTCFGAFGFVPEFDLWIVAALSVLLFFYGGVSMSKQWSKANSKKFVRNIFVAGLIIRLLWVLYCYFFFNPDHFANSFGETADVEWYMPYGQAIAKWATDGFNKPFGKLMDNWGGAIDDVGYPVWLSIIYLIFGVDCDVIIPFLIKVIISAYCSVCIYRVAKRHFGESVARMTAIFVCLNPNMIYWCGNMFKETEMVFLCFLAIDKFDQALYSGKGLTVKSLLPGVLAASALFFFRAALGAVIFLSVFMHVVMASDKVMSFGKKILVGILVVASLLVGVGDSIRSQTESMLNTVQSDHQKENMEWRSRRAGGNSLAKYAGAAVFAPLIFTIPFPTFNMANENQLLQAQLAGGSYIKNVLSYFVILVFLMMLVTGEWRRHVFILAYTVGYHVILVMSEFAQSGRFHMPVMPMMMLFAAYGIQVAKTNGKMRKWFPIVLVLEVFICLAWNWFKLKGRGMI